MARPDLLGAIDPVLKLRPGSFSGTAQQQQPQSQQAVGQNLLGGIEGLTDVAPAASQQKRNLAGMFGIDLRSPIEKINDQLAQAGVNMNTSAGQFQAATLAQRAGLSQQALQLTASATELQKKEQEEAYKAMNYTNLQNSLLQTATDPRDVAQIRTASTYEELEAIRERLAPGGEASTSNYSIETAPGERSILALPTDKDGNLFYDNQWNKPDKLKAIKVGDDLSKVSSGLGGTPQAEKPVNPQPLLEHAIERNYIGQESGNPDGERLLRAIQAGYVTTIEGVNKYFEGDVTTPAAILDKAMKEGLQRQQIIGGAANELDTVQNALNMVNDVSGTYQLGGFFTLTSNLPALANLSEDQIRFNSLLTSLKSDEALNKIEELKAVSAELGGEGTGLGSVQIKEFEALQSAIASLPDNGNRDVWRPGLEKIKFHLMNITRMNQGLYPYVDTSNPAYATSVMVDPITGNQIIVLDQEKGVHYDVIATPSIRDGLTAMETPPQPPAPPAPPAPQQRSNVPFTPAPSSEVVPMPFGSNN